MDDGGQTNDSRTKAVGGQASAFSRRQDTRLFRRDLAAFLYGLRSQNLKPQSSQTIAAEDAESKEEKAKAFSL